MKIILIVLLCILFVGCSPQPYIEDCVIGNESMRNTTYNDFKVDHPDMSDNDFQRTWDISQKTFLRGFVKNGICDEVVYR